MKPKTDLNTAPLASIGIDIGKDIFHVVGLGTDGKIVFRRKIKRLALKEAFENLAPCVVGMEACLPWPSIRSGHSLSNKASPSGLARAPCASPCSKY